MHMVTLTHKYILSQVHREGIFVPLHLQSDSLGTLCSLLLLVCPF